MKRLLLLLGKAYETLWKATTGRPYTHIMRDRPWYFLLPAMGMMTVMAWARRKYGGWVIGLAVTVAAFLGFIAGHVFW